MSVFKKKKRKNLTQFDEYSDKNACLLSSFPSRKILWNVELTEMILLVEVNVNVRRKIFFERITFLENLVET